MASFWDKLKRTFGRGVKPPPVPKAPARIEGGHRGIAAGSWKERVRKQQLEEEVFTDEEQAQWKPLSPDMAGGFVYDAEPLFVHSTNVAMCQYYLESRQMMVEFLNGSAYLYDNVSEQEAIDFAKFPSKGAWVWTNLRVRGSKTAHRKPFRRIK